MGCMIVVREATPEDWQAVRNAYLWVTESNAPARHLYERCGFTWTGKRQPLPADPTLSEITMSRPL